MTRRRRTSTVVGTAALTGVTLLGVIGGSATAAGAETEGDTTGFAIEISVEASVTLTTGEGSDTYELGHALGFRHEHTRPES